MESIQRPLVFFMSSSMVCLWDDKSQYSETSTSNIHPLIESLLQWFEDVDVLQPVTLENSLFCYF